MSETQAKAPFISESNSLTLLGVKGSFTKLGSDRLSPTSSNWLEKSDQELPRYDELPSLVSVRGGRALLIVDPNKARPSGAHLELQKILNRQGFRDLSGALFREDGRSSASMLKIIQLIQRERGAKANGELDRDTLEFIDPSPTLENLRAGRVKLRRTSELRRPGNQAIVELQNKLAIFQGIAFKTDGPIETSGAFSRQLEQIILQFRRHFYLTEKSEIDASILRLIEGESLLDVVRSGAAVLHPQRSGRTHSPSEIATLQRSLGVVLKQLGYINEVKTTGNFDEPTARGLAFLQEISGCTPIHERGNLDAATLEMIYDFEKLTEEKREGFKISARHILRTRILIEALASEQQENLWLKYQDNTRDSYSLLRPISLALLKLGINLGESFSLSAFQRKYQLLESGVVDAATILALYDILRVAWHEERNPTLKVGEDLKHAHLIFDLDRSDGRIKLQNEINPSGVMALIWRDQFNMPRIHEGRATLKAVRLPNDTSDQSVIKLETLKLGWQDQDQPTSHHSHQENLLKGFIESAKLKAHLLSRSMVEAILVRRGIWGLKLIPIPSEDKAAALELNLPDGMSIRIHTMKAKEQEIDHLCVESLAIPA